MSFVDLAGEGGAGGGGNTTITSRSTATQTAINDISQGNISFGDKGLAGTLGRDNMLLLGGGALAVALLIGLKK